MRFEVLNYRFPKTETIGIDVAQIPNEKFQEMRKKGVNMIVGGFSLPRLFSCTYGCQGESRAKKGFYFGR